MACKRSAVRSRYPPLNVKCFRDAICVYLAEVEKAGSTTVCTTIRSGSLLRVVASRVSLPVRIDAFLSRSARRARPLFETSSHAP